MELRHYGDHPVTLNRAWCYDQATPRGLGKPNGLWVSVLGEDDWKQWCIAEGFCLESLQYIHKVALTDQAHIAYISTPEQLDTFHEKYCAPSDFDLKYEYGEDRSAYWGIDWGRVAADYDGIIIAPYLWQRRLMGPSWYYGWDCASGCIWNLDAIADVSLLGEESVEQPGGVNDLSRG